MPQNLAWVKDPPKVQNGPGAFIIAHHKTFINMVSDSTLQLALKKLPLVKLWCSINKEYPQLSKKNFKRRNLKYSSFQLFMCMALFFVNIKID